MELNGKTKTYGIHENTYRNIKGTKENAKMRKKNCFNFSRSARYF